MKTAAEHNELAMLANQNARMAACIRDLLNRYGIAAPAWDSARALVKEIEGGSHECR